MNKTARQLEKKYSKGVISEACEFFETYGKHCTIDELFEMCERINGNNSRRRNICRLFSRIKRDKQVILNYISNGGGSLPSSVKIVSPI